MVYIIGPHITREDLDTPMNYMIAFTLVTLIAIALDNLTITSSDKSQPSVHIARLSRALDFLARHT